MSMNFFSGILISKKDVKMSLRIKTKNHAADSKYGPPLKFDFEADWTHKFIPTASELNKFDDYSEKMHTFQ